MHQLAFCCKPFTVELVFLLIMEIVKIIFLNKNVLIIRSAQCIAGLGEKRLTELMC
jgi:hypothetical protein